MRMFPPEPEGADTPDESRERMLAAWRAIDPKARPAVRMALPFIAAGDYGPAREWINRGLEQAGRSIEQI